jgi:hypothetical protein
VRCSCCDSDRDDSMMAAMKCHPRIKVCRDCIGYLNEQAGGIDVTPTLPVNNMDDAVQFCEAAGLHVRRYDDGFAFVDLNGQSVFDLDLIEGMDPATNHAGCFIITSDAEQWHARLVATGLPVTAIEDKPWGMREFTLIGPSGSNVRIGSNSD